MAEVAKNTGALAVGVVTKPFPFELRQKMKLAEDGIDRLESKVDTLIVIPNERLVQVVEKKTTFRDALREADDILRQAVQGISDLIVIPGEINLDFADVKTIMQNAGTAWMGIGVGVGDNRAVDAAKAAITSPLLETNINGARGVLFNITGGTELTLAEINAASELISEAVDEEANVIFGTACDETMDADVRIIVVATGFGKRAQKIPSTDKKTSIIITPPRKPPSVPTGTGTVEDLDIPEFLRRRDFRHRDF